MPLPPAWDRLEISLAFSSLPCPPCLRVCPLWVPPPFFDGLFPWLMAHSASPPFGRVLRIRFQRGFPPPTFQSLCKFRFFYSFSLPMSWSGFLLPFFSVTLPLPTFLLFFPPFQGQDAPLPSLHTPLTFCHLQCHVSHASCEHHKFGLTFFFSSPRLAARSVTQ